MKILKTVNFEKMANGDYKVTNNGRGTWMVSPVNEDGKGLGGGSVFSAQGENAKDRCEEYLKNMK